MATNTWAQTVSFASLTPTEKRVFDAAAREEFCGCQTAVSLETCLQKYPTCATAQHLARIMIKSAESGATVDEIGAFMSRSVRASWCAAPKSIAVPEAPTMGPAKAPVHLIEFADFRCSHCRHALTLVEQAVKTMGNRVRFTFVPFPLQPASELPAQAALAAAAQNKFWPMHHALFQFEKMDYTRVDLLNIARKVGLNLKKFELDLDSPTTKATVAKLKQAGVQAGVEGTPSFFVNGKRYDLDTTLFTLTQRLALEADLQRGKCP